LFVQMKIALLLMLEMILLITCIISIGRLNNAKFNSNLEFKNNSSTTFWKQNTPLIEYCETLGINIPHYCYHKGLSISGNYRMCLVEKKLAKVYIVSKNLMAHGTAN